MNQNSSNGADARPDTYTIVVQTDPTSARASSPPQENVEEQTLDPWLERLIRNRIYRFPSGNTCLQITAFFLGISEEHVQRLRFSPLVNPIDGSRYGDATFKPYWDALYDHGGWYELITTFGAHPFTHVLFIKDSEALDPMFRKMCSEFAA